MKKVFTLLIIILSFVFVYNIIINNSNINEDLSNNDIDTSNLVSKDEFEKLKNDLSNSNTNIIDCEVLPLEGVSDSIYRLKKTPNYVPNTNNILIENLWFNYSLSCFEVVSIIESANLNWYSGSIFGENDWDFYPICSFITKEKNFLNLWFKEVQLFLLLFRNNIKNYYTLVFMDPTSMDELCIFNSYNNEGWKYNLDFSVDSYSITEINGLIIGQNNDQLSGLITTNNIFNEYFDYYIFNENSFTSLTSFYNKISFNEFSSLYYWLFGNFKKVKSFNLTTILTTFYCSSFFYDVDDKVFCSSCYFTLDDINNTPTFGGIFIYEDCIIIEYKIISGGGTTFTFDQTYLDTYFYLDIDIEYFNF